MPYSKVSVHKLKSIVVSNYCGADWVERRKRKKVIVEEFMNIKPSLKFLKIDGSINQILSRKWKSKHRFTTTSYDFLLTPPKADYFKKRLTNEACNK